MHWSTFTRAALMAAILCICPLSPVLGAEADEQQTEATPASTAEPVAVGVPLVSTDPGISIESPGEKSTNNPPAMHHPPGDLAGSYALNTPARPGFWVAVVFTGLIISAFVATLVLFKTGKAK